MGTDESSSEASLHKKTLVVEEEAPSSNFVADHNLHSGHLGKDDIPHDWLKKKVSGDLDKIEHLYLVK